MARVCEHDFKHRRASTALSPARKVKSQKHGEPRAPLTSHATCANDNQCNAFTPCLFYSIFDPDPLRQNSVHSAVEIRTGIDINVSIAVARHVAQHQLNHSCASWPNAQRLGLELHALPCTGAALLPDPGPKAKYTLNYNIKEHQTIQLWHQPVESKDAAIYCYYMT